MAEAYPNIDKQTLDLIAYPPPFSPDVEYFSDYNYSSNNLRGKVFQFCYRYKYDTKMKSVFSPYSELLIPQGEELPNGDFVPDFHLNNAILVKILTGHHTVDEIEVAYRIGNKGNLYVFDRVKKVSFENIYEGVIGIKLTGTIHSDSKIMDNIGDWGGITVDQLRPGMVIKCKTSALNLNRNYIVSVDVPNNSIELGLQPNVLYSGDTEYNIDDVSTRINKDYCYAIFRNDKVDYPVPSQEELESFDAVPLEAGAMEVVESNRLVVGDIVTGFDSVDIDVNTTLVNSVIDGYIENDKFNKFYFNVVKASYFGDLQGVGFAVCAAPSNMSEGDYIYISSRFTDNLSDPKQTIVINATYYKKSGSTETASEIAQYLIDQLSIHSNQADSDILWHEHNYHVMTLKELKTENQTAMITSFYDDNPNPGESYQKGSIAKFGLYYYVAIKDIPFLIIPPTGTSGNSNWDYLSDNDEEIFIMRACESGDYDGDLFTYSLDSAAMSLYGDQSTYNKFKDGHRVNIAIEYLDYARRPSAALRTDQMAVNVPFLSEVPTSVSISNAIVNSISLSIKNRPPEWAYYYNILIDNNTPWFYQFFFKGFGSGEPDIEDDNIHYKINVNRAIQNLRDYLPKSILEPYIFAKGDRIRILAYRSRVFVIAGLPTPEPNNVWRKFNTVLDSEIIGYDYDEGNETYLKDDTGEYIKDNNNNKVRDASTGHIIVEKFNVDEPSLLTAEYLIYEIYRPKKSSDTNTSYWETHKTFEIGNPGEEGRYHKGDTDQGPLDLSGHPAVVDLNIGNVYKKMRYSGEADVYFPVESMHLSDYYESNDISIGRANAISEDLGQVHEESAYVHSGIMMEDTAINQLNKFFPGSKGWLQSKHGRISAFREKGFILYTFQPKKVTSVYIGRQTLVNPDGTEEVKMLTDSVFGTVRPATADYGTSYPKSICESMVHLYFWDDNTSDWCRIAYNGIFPVSDYGMNKFFSDLNEGVISKEALAVYDNKKDELIVSHKAKTTDDYYISFNSYYTAGENKITSVGRLDSTDINDFEVGMILTELTTSYVTPQIELTIVKIDKPNRTIYLDGVIPFDSSVTGTMVLAAVVLKKRSMSTVAFHEPVNGWKTKYPFYPEFMIAYGDKLLSFIHGKSYLHHEGNYGEYYGTFFEQYIRFPFNPGMIVLFNGIEITADHLFKMIEKGDVTVVSEDANGNMESKLVKLRNVEGKYVASFLRDQNSPGDETETYKLVNGRFLRGQTIVLKMTNFEEEKVILHNVVIYFTQSI